MNELHSFDWNGAAIFVGAIVAGAGSMATLYMQIVTWRDNRNKNRNDARRERTLNKVAKAVNVTPAQDHNE